MSRLNTKIIMTLKPKPWDHNEFQEGVGFSCWKNWKKEWKGQYTQMHNELQDGFWFLIASCQDYKHK